MAICSEDDIECVSFCPEQVLGTPRPPIEYVWVPNEPPDVVEIETGRSVLGTLQDSVDRIAWDLMAQPLHGIICKSRSPSCALLDARYKTADLENSQLGPGLFILTMQERMPGIPIIDDLGLIDSVKRADFLHAVRSEQE